MKRFLYIFLIIVSILASCKGKETEEIQQTAPKAESVSGTLPSAAQEDRGYVRRIKVRDVGPFSTVFNDSNFLQLEAARRQGINPVEDLYTAYFTNRPIVKISDSENYKIDSLTHSLPYLVPEAAMLLNDIGASFKDSLSRRGGDSHLIKVTSLLRTPESVGRLRRVNINATDSSTHQYGTTFDISYTNFYCSDLNRQIHQGDLKNLLAEVLNQMKQNGRCYVKYERKTGCFHVTVR